MKAAIYTRVSSQEQAKEGYSLLAQDARCKSFVESQGWEYFRTYMDDGYSAKDLNRPAMTELLEDMKQGLFDVVVVYRLDRLTRSVLDLHELLKIFDKYKVAFKSTTEAFETTTAMGRFFITLVGAMAEWERHNLGERVMVGMAEKARGGKRVGSRSPYGYDLVDGKLVVNETEAQVVKRIFQMYKTMGMLSICRVLNDEGIQTKSGEFNTYSIKFILENPVYIGKNRWNYQKGRNENVIITEADHEPIIDEETFNQVQVLIKERQVKGSKVLTSELPYSGILKCGRCGSSISGQIGRRPNKLDYYNYCCSNRKHKGVCDLPNLSERVLDHVFLNHINWRIDTSEMKSEPPQDNYEERRKEIEAQIEQIKKRRKNWHFAFGNEQITLDELRELTQEDREKEKKLLEELESLPTYEPVQTIDIDQFKKKMDDLKNVWEYATRSEKKQLIHSLFSEIVVDVIDEPMSDWPKRRGRVPRQVEIISFTLR